METTHTLTLTDNTDRADYVQMLAAAESIPPELRNATLTSATWVKVTRHGTAHQAPQTLDGMHPDDRDPNGLWISKVYPHAAEPGGYAVKRELIPWAGIRSIEIMAVDTAEQPF